MLSSFEKKMADKLPCIYIPSETAPFGSTLCPSGPPCCPDSVKYNFMLKIFNIQPGIYDGSLLIHNFQLFTFIIKTPQKAEKAFINLSFENHMLRKVPF